MGQALLYDVVITLNQDMSTSFISPAISTEGFNKFFIKILCTGSPVGILSVQESNDYEPQQPGSPGNWADIAFNPTMVALTGSNQDYEIDFTLTAIPYIRINYIFTSGTGSMYSVISAKEI